MTGNPSPGEEARAPSRATAPLRLVVRDVVVRFGEITALDGVSFEVAAGEICGLIGPNGSGKTTLFNCLSGFCIPRQGQILLNGAPITELPRHRRAGLGLGRTFQNLALFRSMTVRDNILTGLHPLGRAIAPQAAARLGEMLDLLGLDDVADVPAGALPFGTAKRVEIGRALIAGPDLLLLDEPACGLNHTEVDALQSLLMRIHARGGLSILLVEHHMGLVMRACSHVVALAAGVRIADGTPRQVQQDPAVIAAYLGPDETDAHAA